MQINIPQDLFDRLRVRASINDGDTEADVIRQALDSLEGQDAERTAIQEGINAMRDGRTQTIDREFRYEHDIAQGS